MRGGHGDGRAGRAGRPVPAAGAALLLALLWAAGRPASAQHGDFCLCGQRDRYPLSFQIDHQQHAYREQALAAMQRWNVYANLFAPQTGDGRAGINGINEIIFFQPETIFETYGLAIDTSVFAITALLPEAAYGEPRFNACPKPAGTRCGTLTETDILINGAFYRGWTAAAPTDSGTGPASYIATAVHELGHTLGIHHNFDSLSTMNYYADRGLQYIGRSDANAARAVAPALAIQDLSALPFRYQGFQGAGYRPADVDRYSVVAGAAFQLLDFTVENLGPRGARDVELTVYLSPDDSVGPGDFRAGRLYWPLFEGSWDSGGQVFEVPADTPPGVYFVGARVTVDNGHDDAVAYNNAWTLDAARKLTVYDPDRTGATPLINMSTNTAVSGRAAIAGFIIDGGPRRIVVLGENQGGLSDPVIELTDLVGNKLYYNDNWREWARGAELTRLLGREPGADSDAMLDAELAPGVYLAWMWDRNGRQGRGNVQLTDLDALAGGTGAGELLNLSTNSVIDADGALAGFIITRPQRLIALGENIDGMADPVLEITDLQGRSLGLRNDDWGDLQDAADAVSELGREPLGPRDAMLRADLPAGVYLAWLRDKDPGRNGRGNVQVFRVRQP